MYILLTLKVISSYPTILVQSCMCVSEQKQCLLANFSIRPIHHQNYPSFYLSTETFQHSNFPEPISICFTYFLP